MCIFKQESETVLLSGTREFVVKNAVVVVSWTVLIISATKGK